MWLTDAIDLERLKIGHRNGVAIGLSGHSYFLPIRVGIDLVLIGDLLDFAVLSHEYHFVSIADAGRDALSIGPHALASRRATLIDNISCNSARRKSRGIRRHLLAPRAFAFATARAGRFERRQFCYLIYVSQAVQIGSYRNPVTLEGLRKPLCAQSFIQKFGRSESFLNMRAEFRITRQVLYLRECSEALHVFAQIIRRALSGF